MFRNHFAKASAIGTVALGLLAASMGAGCGAGAGQGPGSDGTSSEPSRITEEKIAVAGCGAVGTFLFTAPQFINWIAMNAASNTNNSTQSSVFNTNQMQLYAVTNNNQLVQVNQAFQNASAMQQSALFTAANTFNLAQQASQFASSQFASNYAATTNNVSEIANVAQQNAGSSFASQNTANTNFAAASGQQFANAHTNAFNNGSQFANANAFNNAGSNVNQFANNNASQVANQNANQFANTNAFGNTANTLGTFGIAGPVGAFGGVGVGFISPLFSNKTIGFTSFANGANTASAVNNNLFNAVNNNTAVAANTNAWNNANQNTSAAYNNASGANTNTNSGYSNVAQNANTTHVDSQQAFNNFSALTSSRALNAMSTALNQVAANQATTAASSIANQAATNATSNAVNSQITNTNALVWNNLSQFNANQFVLQANLTTSQINQVLQFFQGVNSNTVSQAAAFPIATPGCI
jgi:hypothetical protein